MDINIGILKLALNLRASEIHKFRGFIGNLFKEHELIHNHDLNTGNPIYRYPLIQFKLIDKKAIILAIGDEALDIFSKIFIELNEIDIDGYKIAINEKQISTKKVEFGFSDELFIYEFISPWLGLNQKNYKNYTTSNNDERAEIFKKSLTGNILSISKYLDYWLTKDQKIKVSVNLKPVTVKLKGETMIGFTGIFKTNFIIPDYFGIGKSVSRGFGTVKRLL